jgi:RNA polymerase sigma-70 factor, ECF subfamily
MLVSGDQWMSDPTAPERPGEQKAEAVGEPRETRLRRVLDVHLDFAARTLRTYGVSEADVDDGVQQVCLVLADKLDRIEPGSERSFVFRTAQRIASRIRRTRARRREEPEQRADERQEPIGPEQIADERQAMDALSRLLDSLEDGLREVFVLYEIEELTMAAIAELLELPPGTVASRLRRAREQFQVLAEQFRRGQEGAS